MEARAEAQRKAKQAADAAWRKAQWERELQRAQVISHLPAKLSLEITLSTQR